MSTDSPTNSSSYLNELIKELQTLTNKYETNHGAQFRHSYILLVREIKRVWDMEMLNNQGDMPTTPAGHDYSSSSAIELATIGNLLKTDSSAGSTSRRNSFSPMAMKMVREEVEHEAEESQGRVEKSVKLFIKESTTSQNANPIGRLIGPRGMTIRQFEKDFGCKLFIRGKGCTKDEEKEARMKGRPGWDHLDEPIHVLISARADSDEACSEKLESIKSRLEDFLDKPDSALKRSQLMQLAVIEGTLK